MVTSVVSWWYHVILALKVTQYTRHDVAHNAMNFSKIPDSSRLKIIILFIGVLAILLPSVWNSS